ncbi:hypothetical protein VP1G_05594 [Cytospora mali]|uniref:Uncharacterized protein n=1 Tax=Cytospora mali TaxID=578113 RepID=A0A194V2W8_CYTMA|nr:hypothetical protein VP1G_05594 [Valsa mali var. pyri (nom. inval.)]
MDIRGARPVVPDPGQPMTPTSIYDDDRYSSSRRPFGAHGPFNPNFDKTLSPGGVGIPNAPSHDIPPPPLPPPRFVPVTGLQPHHEDYYSHQQRKQSYTESVFGGRSDSVYGSSGQSWKSRPAQDEVPNYRQRESNTTPTGRDEGYSSYASSGSRDKAPSFRVHDHYQFPNNASSSYDNQQLKKLDAKRTLDNRSPPRGSALSASMRSLQDGPTALASGDRTFYQLPQLSLPARPKAGPGFESPRYTDTPLSSAVSPRSTPFAQISRPQDYRSSPIEPTSAIEFNHSHSPYSRNRRHNSGPFPDELTPSDTYDHEMDTEETSRLRHLYIDDSHHSRMNSFDNQSVVSLKRRASSPPVEDGALRHMSSQGDLLRRREGYFLNLVWRSEWQPWWIEYSNEYDIFTFIWPKVAYWLVTDRYGDFALCGTELPDPEPKVYNYPSN